MQSEAQVMQQAAQEQTRQEAIIRNLRMLYLNSRKTSFSEKNRAMKAATSASVSLASTAIYTRDRVEAEILARRRADLNRAAMAAEA